MVTAGRSPSVSHQESFGCGYQPSARQPRTRPLLLTSSRVMTGEEAAPGGKVRVMTGQEGAPGGKVRVMTGQEGGVRVMTGRRLHLGVGLG